METTTRKINIAVVDDHYAILSGYQSILLKLDYVNSVHGFATSQELFAEMKQTNFDLILLDIQLKDEDGLDICKLIKVHNNNTKVIMESTFDNSNYILKANENGADGYILKSGNPSELRHAVERVVFHNEKYFTDVALQIILNESASNKLKHIRSKTDLSEREIQIIQFICDGMSDKKIAETLYLSESTISNHRQNIMKKINCHKSTEIITYAIKNGIYTLLKSTKS